MRIAIFSDIHGNMVGLEACLRDLAAQGGADLLVAAGDLCLDGPKPAKVVDRLIGLGAYCVRGNTDRMIAEGESDLDDVERESLRWQREQLGDQRVAWLGALPFSRRYGSEGNELLVVHANPKTDDDHIWPDASDVLLERMLEGEKARVLAFGHLHLPYVRMWRDRMLVNVASAGLPKDGDPRVGYAILTERSGGWQVKHRRVPFDIERVARQLKKSGMPDCEERLEVLKRHRYKKLKAIIP